MPSADEFTSPPILGDGDREYVEPAEAARRMGLTTAQLDDLLRRGAVRYRRNGWAIEVEPCIVNVTPEPEKRKRPRTPRK